MSNAESERRFNEAVYNFVKELNSIDECVRAVSPHPPEFWYKLFLIRDYITNEDSAHGTLKSDMAICNFEVSE